MTGSIRLRRLKGGFFCSMIQYTPWPERINNKLVELTERYQLDFIIERILQEAQAASRKKI